MKSAEAVKLLNVPESTLRKYAQDYSVYLSMNPGPHQQHHREYSEMDIRKLRLIIEMKAQKVSRDNIDATLSSLQASQWERLPPLEAPIQSIIPTQDNMIILQNEKSALLREIGVLREMLEKADERADARVAAATSDRDELLRRLHEAEQLVRLYESGRIKPE